MRLIFFICDKKRRSKIKCLMKFITVKKKTIVAVFLCCVLASAIVCTAYFSAMAVSSSKNRQTIVIDAGHGGEDAGVLGARTGVRESDLNLKIAKLVGEYLKGAGFRVVYTRTNDTMRTHPKVNGNKKRADMFARGDIINDAKPSAVVSIHMNYYSAQSRRGAQVFFDATDDEGHKFADVMQSLLNENLNSIGNGREYSALSAEKYLLSCSPYPSIIVECGFLSNPFDERNLTNPNYQLLVAQTIYQGIVAYLGNETL